MEINAKLKIFLVAGIVLGAICSLFITPFLAWHVLRYEWLNIGFLRYLYLNPFVWTIFLGVVFRCIGYLVLKKKYSLRPPKFSSVFIMIISMLLVAIVTVVPTGFWLWMSGSPFESIEYRTVIRESEPVYILQNKKTYVLRSEYKIVNFGISDGNAARTIYSKFFLNENSSTQKSRIIQEWKFNTGLLEKLFLSTNQKTLVIVFLGRDDTKIFEIDPQISSIKEIKDFFNVLDNQNEVIRKYALFALAVRFLPKSSFMRFDGGEENSVNIFIARLGKYAGSAALEVIKEKIESNDLWFSLRGLEDYRGGDSISERAAVILAHLGIEEAIIPIIENQAALFSRTRLLGLSDGNKKALEIYGEKARPHLIRASQHKDPMVREFSDIALRQLDAGEVGSRKISKPTSVTLSVKEFLDNLRHGIEIQNSINKLAKVNDEDIPLLIGALNDNDPVVRLGAVAALDKIDNKEALISVAEMVNDENSKVRESALRYLVNHGNQDTIPYLIQILNNPNSRDEEVMQATIALEKNKDVSAIEPLISNFRRRLSILYENKIINLTENILCSFGETAIPHLISALETEDDKVRAYAAETLGMTKNREATLPLIKAYEDNKSPRYVKSYIFKALALIGDNSAIDLMGKTLIDKKEDLTLREDAAEALGMFKDSKATRPLITVLEYPEIKAFLYNRLGYKAAKSLGKIGDKSAVMPLIDVLNGGITRMQQGAAEALGEIGDKSAIPPLMDLIKKIGNKANSLEKNPSLFWLRVHIVKALALLEEKEAIPLIEDLIKDTKEISSDNKPLLEVREELIKYLKALRERN